MVAVNEAIVDNPALVNQSPHGEGWFFKIKMSAPTELEALMEFGEYKRSLGVS